MADLGPPSTLGRPRPSAASLWAAGRRCSPTERSCDSRQCPADAHVRLRVHRCGGGAVHHASVGLPEQLIGVAFAANTAVIVLAQMLVLGLIRGRSRSRMLASVGLAWAGAWLLFAAALGLPGQAAQVAALVAGMSVFALGETIWSPTGPALVNDWRRSTCAVGTTPSSRSSGASRSVGSDPHRAVSWPTPRGGLWWTVTLGLGCLVSALLLARLRRHLTPAQDGASARPPEVTGEISAGTAPGASA